MKIGIEAQRIFRKKKHGMDIVALELIRQLKDIDHENEYFIFAQSDEDDNILESSKNFQIIKTTNAPYPVWEQWVLPAQVRKHKIDLLHCTSNTAPLRISIPLVLTLHDIIYLEKVNLRQGTWYQRLGNLYRRWNVPRAVKIASKIITVSDFENRRINDFFDLHDNSVQTVYNGVGSHFRRITDKDRLDQMRKKYSLPEEFVFFLGNTDPKKNVNGVLSAYRELIKSRADIPLVMPDIDRDYLSGIAAQTGSSDVLDRIIFTGYIPNEELPAIYSMAKIFLYPSLRESFGIPIVEAMACGTPVITSNTSSMPEVAGDAAVLIDPSDAHSIASSIHQLWNDDLRRSDLSEKGKQRSTFFSWGKNAEHTLQLYHDVLKPDKNKRKKLT